MSLVLVFLSIWLFYLTVGVFLWQFSLFAAITPANSELAITDKGYYQDIDVEYYRALYKQEQAKKQPKAIHREAEGFPLPHFWV
ncbi:hypothetical protein, partial [Vibrio neptunius]